MRIAKFLALGVAAIVVLLVVAIAIVASTFDPNDYKGVAANAFTARTGRSLKVDEDLHLTYFPWLALETGGVTIGSAPGEGTTVTIRLPGVSRGPAFRHRGRGRRPPHRR